MNELVAASELWDKNIVNVQVSDAKESVIEIRALFSARNSDAAGDLASLIREKLITFVQQECPEALPRKRSENRVTMAASEPPPPEGSKSDGP